MEPATLDDLRIIERQLGRPPRGVRGIAVRCEYGYPQVVVVHPIVEGKPFPTTYWLTCPYLARKIDRIEARGMIREIEARLRADPDFAARVEAAHRDYINTRLQLLSPQARTELDRTGLLAPLETRGIGGTADFSRIKCLHMHVAHALAAANPVGALVLAGIPDRACPPDGIICHELEESA